MNNLSIHFEQAKQNIDRYSTLLLKWQEGEELSEGDLATLYYGTPLNGHTINAAVVALADTLYKKQQYRVAYHLYATAIEQFPTSILLLKKAYNCCYLGAFNKAESEKLLRRRDSLAALVEGTGTGSTAQDPIVVTHVSDEYHYLYNTLRVSDVATRNAVDKQGEITLDELTVTVRGEKQQRKVYFACYGETDADAQDFFIRKKGF